MNTMCLWNAPFTSFMRGQATWMWNTPGVYRRGSSYFLFVSSHVRAVALWIADMWHKVHNDVTTRVLYKCGMSNTLDGNEDACIREGDKKIVIYSGIPITITKYQWLDDRHTTKPFPYLHSLYIFLKSKYVHLGYLHYDWENLVLLNLKGETWSKIYPTNT